MWPILRIVRIRLENRSASRFVVLTAMLLALGFTGVENGVVLCFGDDGHVAVEAVGPEGCVEVEEAASDVASQIAIPTSSSHCGPCVDVAITASSTTEATSVAKRTGASPATIAVATLRPYISALRATIPAQHVSRFISEKPYTVVIRC